MNSFSHLLQQFNQHFALPHFPTTPSTLYEPNNYFLTIGGKRVRPVMCLMANELFSDIHNDAWQVATAIELFHNFTLIHDDIMDKASLRRGMETVHHKYGENTAILSGDVMLIVAYEYLNKIDKLHLHHILQIFNKTAKEVCEGQQLDMDFEKSTSVSLQDYIKMIELKTSVLLAASLEMGALLGGASEGNRRHLYEFGRNLGIAFQIQDDYLDAFGDPTKFGKDVGGDIKQNKKTFLLIHALEVANNTQKATLETLLNSNAANKVAEVLAIYKDCKVDEWAKKLKDTYLEIALKHLDDTAVVGIRKKPLQELANFLIQRDY